MKILLKTPENPYKLMEIQDVDIVYTYTSSEGADISGGRVEIYSAQHDFFYGFIFMNENDWENAAISYDNYLNLRRGYYYSDVEEYLADIRQ